VIWLFWLGCGKAVGEGDGVLDADEVPQVGWVAELTDYHHGVGGTAVIVDEQTLEVRDFTYDGGGINSRLYLLVDGEDFHNDWELTENLVGDEISGETLTLDIPADLADFNLITLWCVPAAVSFGDGVFHAPGDD
jgi:hypothetical protein